MFAGFDWSVLYAASVRLYGSVPLEPSGSPEQYVGVSSRIPRRVAATAGTAMTAILVIWVRMNIGVKRLDEQHFGHSASSKVRLLSTYIPMSVHKLVFKWHPSSTDLLLDPESSQADVWRLLD